MIDQPLQHRIRISDDTKDLLDAESTRTGHPYDVLIQLWATAALDTAAADIATDTLELPAATQAEMRHQLQETAPNLRVVGIRLDKWHASPTVAVDGYGFSRTHAGADLTTRGHDLWLSARGYWVIGTRSNCIATFRLGRFGELYGGVTWSAPQDKRRYALGGYRVEGGYRVDCDSESITGPASPDEIAALHYLQGHTLVLPAGAANPVVNLFD